MDDVDGNNFKCLSQGGSSSYQPMDNLFQIYQDKVGKKTEQQRRFFSGQKQVTEPIEQLSNNDISNSDSNAKEKGKEAVQIQLISFYEQNLQNLKQMVIDKDEDIKIRDEKILEQSILINLIITQYNKILNLLQQERDEILEKYMGAMDEIQNQSQKYQQQQNQQQQQLQSMQQKIQQQLHQQLTQHLQNFQVPTDYDSKLIELHETKQQVNHYKNQCINLEVKVKETEVKLEDANLRLNEAYIRIDLLEKEARNVSQQNVMLDQQFKSLLQQFEQYQQIQKKQSQQLQFREATTMMSSAYSNASSSEQQILQNLSQNASKHEGLQENDNLINAYKQFKKQNSIKQFNQMLVQSQIKQQNSKQDPQQVTYNQGGILNFPSDFRTQQQKDLEFQLTNQLNELTIKKQTLESELNKKINISKSALERRKREQLEQELDQIQDQINKVRLKLRENKFI
ncbi:unnamed protein product (macronuclear) [Paramecium tetraurelia]|uniref:Enkurin domain-containing protein n=1 Tax=Paramecium tetraurelia TaxID=5888 RepID=A0EI37_PARTE|nr:uncharacterized protein GSPATT00027305001 [Paramecium tetraurelia]CAK94978.1 unnamed protein product [Paramecium tetraurelia]|eukprot:XP_001462351.1 hypothetical protein (macronuclear) [Paramecium tetraurelia strain d4-2]